MAGVDDSSGGDRLERGADEIGSRLYATLNCLVAPRPIAWVSTLGPDGVANLAPHSFFTVASADPAVVQFTSIGRKDSLRNVEATGEFVVNVVPWALREPANATSVDAPAGVDEFVEAGLATEPSVRVRPPRVARSPAAIECRLVEVRSFGTGPAAGHVVFGAVLHVAVDRAVLADDGLPDARLLALAARGDRSHWVAPGELVTIHRPRWADRVEG
jgi:flavin reductase (DIM6/NTAB) family NADH-FMN oxidoreductase RutF